MLDARVLAVIGEEAAKRAKRTQVDADHVIKGIKAITDDVTTKNNDRLKGYELLGRHLAMFTDKHDHTTGGEPLAAPVINVSVGGKDG